MKAPVRNGVRLRTREIWLVAAALSLAILLGAGVGTVMAEDLKAGDMAPAFSLPGSDGRTYTLAEHKGKRIVVLAWFPKAFTGG